MQKQKLLAAFNNNKNFKNRQGEYWHYSSYISKEKENNSIGTYVPMGCVLGAIFRCVPGCMTS